MATDVITITESSKFLLSCRVPNIELNLTVVSEEWHRVHFDAECGDVLLLELTCQVTLHKCGLADATVSDEHELEFLYGLVSLFNHLNLKY